MADFRRLQQQMTAWLRDPGRLSPPALEARRLEIYRELIHGNIRDFVDAAYPVLKSLLVASDWDELLRAFMAGHRAQSPYFRDIPLEFCEWLQSARPAWLQEHPWIAELLHYEWMLLAADHAETAPDAAALPAADLLQGRPCLRQALWPLAYRWPVHELGPENPPLPEPPAQATCLLLYRDDDDKVSLLVVSALSARLVEMMQASRTCSGRELLQQLAVEAAVPADAAAEEAFVQAGTAMLADLQRLGVILGVCLPADGAPCASQERLSAS